MKISGDDPNIIEIKLNWKKNQKKERAIFRQRQERRGEAGEAGISWVGVVL